MRTQVKLAREGDGLLATLAPSQASAMYEALSHLRERDFSDAELTLLVGARREAVDVLLDRLAGPHTESRDFRFAPEELHMVHSALTAVPTMFLVRGGAFTEEPFHIRVGFYRENFDALANAIVQAAAGV
ncbi:hypothetical protein F7R91_22255 [Streptomyces luteolifulvus]|uniref:Uncharacterized protein n=1 Tax=Streptomyces luteolifulvus TaxID=2615112 RepID=A0A6H9UXN8_9ACTN|nr:hypothetical protein [Streptomyces luteolifulvus]KAB1144528.1 hypothetical protein F7R91_22255 [Streptomyces luteolifulvus]